MSNHDASTPSPNIVRWAPHVRIGLPVLDVAAGGGRHARLFADRGHDVVAVDRDVSRLQHPPHARIEGIQADLEGAPWPLSGRTFAAVVVVNYLWRPLLPMLLQAVAPGGFLMYETFAVGNERFGRPKNPDFLLRPDELLDLARPTLQVLEFAQGPEGEPADCVRQRLLARRP